MLTSEMTHKERAVVKHAETTQDVDARLDGGNTLAHALAYQGCDAALQVLKNRGADFTLKNASGYTPVHQAILGKKEKALGVVVSTANLNEPTQDADEYTPLMLAVIKNFPEGVALLIKYQADVNATSQKGFTAAYIAAENGHTACLQHLLAAKAAPTNAVNKVLDTPLYRSLLFKHYECAALLLMTFSEGVFMKQYESDALFAKPQPKSLFGIFSRKPKVIRASDAEQKSVLAAVNQHAEAMITRVVLGQATLKQLSKDSCGLIAAYVGPFTALADLPLKTEANTPTLNRFSR